MSERILKPCYGSIDVIGAIRRSQSPLSTALGFAEAVVTTEQTNESHFPQGAQLIHAGLDLLTAIDPSLTDGLRNKRTSWSLFTNQDKFRAALELMAESDHEALRDQANAFLDVGDDDREMRGIKSSLRTQCSRTYSEPALMDTLCHDSADFSRLNDEPITVYIVLPGALVDVHFRYIKLLLTYLLGEIERGGLRRFS